MPEIPDENPSNFSEMVAHYEQIIEKNSHITKDEKEKLNQLIGILSNEAIWDMYIDFRASVLLFIYAQNHSNDTFDFAVSHKNLVEKMKAGEKVWICENYVQELLFLEILETTQENEILLKDIKDSFWENVLSKGWLGLQQGDTSIENIQWELNKHRALLIKKLNSTSDQVHAIIKTQ